MVGRLWNTSASEANQFFGRKKQWSVRRHRLFLTHLISGNARIRGREWLADDVLDKEVWKT